MSFGNDQVSTFMPDSGPLLYAMPIDALRKEIDRIDEQIIDLIAQRQRIAARIAQAKLLEGVPIHDEERSSLVQEQAFNLAVEKNINPLQVQAVFRILVDMSEERQRECTGDGNLP
jgi:chorismate mutase